MTTLHDFRDADVSDEVLADDLRRCREAFDADGLTTPNITVSIGRNIGAEPMDSPSWYRFQLRLHDALEESGEIVCQTIGRSVWTDTDGLTTSEESYSVVVAPYGPAEVERIRADLAGLARTYCQDSIALTNATAEFVRPD